MPSITKTGGTAQAMLIGSPSWDNPANALVEGGGSTTTNLSLGNSSDELQVRDFSFGIPNNATITGVVIVVKKMGGVSIAITDSYIMLRLPDNTPSANRGTETFWPGALTNVTHGSPSDLWGVALTPTIINSSLFGVKLKAKNYNYQFLSEVAIDVVSITVHYTMPPATTSLFIFHG